MNIVNAFIGFGIAFVGALIASLMFWKDSDSASVEASEARTAAKAAPVAEPAADAGVADTELMSPLTGTAIPLSQVPDAVFAGGALGDGVAVVPTEGIVKAPADATVVTVFESKHAITLRADSGAEILIHVGLDTVKLQGAPFEALVANGEHVIAGQPLLKVDLEAIKTAGYDTTTPVVVLNSARYGLTPLSTGEVAAGDPLLALTVKGGADVAVS